jgi:hypothetical protein
MEKLKRYIPFFEQEVSISKWFKDPKPKKIRVKIWWNDKNISWTRVENFMVKKLGFRSHDSFISDQYFGSIYSGKLDLEQSMKLDKFITKNKGRISDLIVGRTQIY